MKNDLILTLPPLMDPTAPSASIPILAAYLKKNDFVNFSVRDLNIEYVDWILNSKRLKKYYKKIFKWVKLQSKPKKIKEKDLERWKYWYCILSEKKYEKEISFVDKAKKILRSEQFYNADDYIRASENLSFIFNFIRISTYPFLHSLIFLECVNNSLSTKEDLINAIEQYEELLVNPLYDFIKEKVLKDIKKEQPKCIGFSIPCSTQIFTTVFIAKHIKENFPNIRTLVGGSAISQVIENIIDGIFDYNENTLLPYVDDIIYGDSELPLLEYAKAIKNDSTVDRNKIPNLVQANGVFSKELKNIWVADNLNEIPMPDYSKLPLKLYLSPEPVLGVVPTRGCYYSKCVFCREGYRGFGNIDAACKYIEKDVSMFANELAQMKKSYNVDCFSFGTSAVRAKYLIELSDKILERNLDIGYCLDLRMDPKYKNKEITNKLFKGGMRVAAIGLESFSQSVLDKMEKGTTVEDIEIIFESLSNDGVAIRPLWFLGFPGENEKDISRTVDFLIRNREHVHEVKDVLQFVVPLGSKVFNDPNEFGINIKNEYGIYDPLASFEYKKDIADYSCVEKMSDFFPSLRNHVLFAYFISHALLLSKKSGRKSLREVENTIFNNDKKSYMSFEEIKKAKFSLKLKNDIFISKINIDDEGKMVDSNIAFSEDGYHLKLSKRGENIFSYLRKKRSVVDVETYLNEKEIPIESINLLLDGDFLDII